MPSVILTQLSKIFGPAIAAKIITSLRSSEGGSSKMKKVLEAVEHGTSVIAALRLQFGPLFQSVLNEHFVHGANGWSYEAGTQQYIKISPEEGGNNIDVLKDELNINLDRLAEYAGLNTEIDITNHFRGFFSCWRRRYAELVGMNQDAESTFAAIDELLDGQNKSFMDAFKTMARTCLGGTGAILIIKGLLLAAGVGLGLWGSIVYWFSGIAFGTVGAIAIPGVLLVYLSMKAFSGENAMNACVKMAYQLLERSQA